MSLQSQQQAAQQRRGRALLCVRALWPVLCPQFLHMVESRGRRECRQGQSEANQLFYLVLMPSYASRRQQQIELLMSASSNKQSLLVNVKCIIN